MRGSRNDKNHRTRQFYLAFGDKVDFDDGVTVFVGDNGAGKSSIIDAITFALFGEHTRKSNKSLIRRGNTQAYAKVRFSSKSRTFEATRKIDSKGTLAAQFVEIQGDQEILRSAGERRQFGESTTHEIESTLGLDFQKLKVASIVQQGELSSIIKAKPKEFKELLNAIIGIDKLDLASENLKMVQKSFRQTIYRKFGYDDTHIPLLEKEIEEKNLEIKNCEPQMFELQQKKEAKAKELEMLQSKISLDSAKELTLKQIEERKSEFTKYVKDAIISIQKIIIEKERKIRDCQGCFEISGEKDELEVKLESIKSQIEDSRRKSTELETKKAVLIEYAELAKASAPRWKMSSLRLSCEQTQANLSSRTYQRRTRKHQITNPVTRIKKIKPSSGRKGNNRAQ